MPVSALDNGPPRGGPEPLQHGNNQTRDKTHTPCAVWLAMRCCFVGRNNTSIMCGAYSLTAVGECCASAPWNRHPC